MSSHSSDHAGSKLNRSTQVGTTTGPRLRNVKKRLGDETIGRKDTNISGGMTVRPLFSSRGPSSLDASRGRGEPSSQAALSAAEAARPELQDQEMTSMLPVLPVEHLTDINYRSGRIAPSAAQALLRAQNAFQDLPEDDVLSDDREQHRLSKVSFPMPPNFDASDPLTSKDERPKDYSITDDSTTSTSQQSVTSVRTAQQRVLSSIPEGSASESPEAFEDGDEIFDRETADTMAGVVPDMEDSLGGRIGAIERYKGLDSGQ